MASGAEKRAKLIQRARILRGEIEQIFIDVAHWNEYVRRPDELPIDPDPEGELRAWAKFLDRVLASEGEEPGYGHGV